MSERVKAKIIQIGSFDDNGLPTGWGFHFEDANGIGMACIEDGVVYFGGYTIEELHKIASSKRTLAFKLRLVKGV